MKRIQLPAPREISTRQPDGSTITEQMTAADVLDRVVFAQPMWRHRAHLAHGLSLIKKLRAAPIIVTEPELESLEKGCELPGLQVTPPALNHFFLEIVGAVFGALTEADPPEKATP